MGGPQDGGSLEATVTDADGRFRLRGLQDHLGRPGPSIQTRHVELDHERDLAELRLVVGRMCRVVVERGAADFDRFPFVSEQGGKLEFVMVTRGMWATIGDAGMPAERSAECLVTDLARELVLLSGPREVARLPIALVPGELNVLHR
ncbi:MAG: hypothetical protein HOP15_04885 [Planctomycetes bacterium]|nr:hypothetical protein [Planctomycetota bacterium]